MKDNTETTPENCEETWSRKLTKQTIWNFTTSAATAAGFVGALILLSALAKPKLRTQREVVTNETVNHITPEDETV